MMNKSIQTSRVWFVICTIVLGASFALGVGGLLPVPSIEIRWPTSPTSPSNQYVPTYSTKVGKEIVLIYIGSSSCAYANDEALPSLIENLKLALQRKASEKEYMFTTIGVAIDWFTEKGVEHLTKFGTFDEVIAGRKWQSTGARRFFWEALPGQAATPQVLVIARDVQAPTDEQPEQPFQVANETLLVRKLGSDEIKDWLEQGTPLPQDFLETSTHAAM